MYMWVWPAFEQLSGYADANEKAHHSTKGTVLLFFLTQFSLCIQQQPTTALSTAEAE